MYPKLHWYKLAIFECYAWIHVRIWKNEVSKASDYHITPISLLVVFLTRESAALIQAQGPSLFIIKKLKYINIK